MSRLADVKPLKPHEQIRASLIYYYHTDPGIEDEGLAFRRPRHSKDRPNVENEYLVRLPTQGRACI